MKIAVKPITLKKREKPSIVDILFLLYFVITSFYPNNVILKFGFIALMSVTLLKIVTWKDDRKIVVPLYCFILMNFAAYSYISKMWALNAYLVDSQIILLVSGVATCFIMTNYFIKVGRVNTILYTIAISGIAVSIYTIITYGGLSAFYEAATQEMARLGGEVGNENVIGMLSAYSVVVLFYYALYKNIKINYIIMILPAIVMAATGSRKALLVFIIGVSLLVYFKQRKNQGITKFFKMICWGLVAFLVLRFVLSLEIFSTVNERMEMLFNMFSGENASGGASADIRREMIEVGLEQFEETPLFGVGLYNSVLVGLYRMGYAGYLHNDYVELLVNGGLVGFVIYYSVPFALLIKHTRLMNTSDDPELIISFVMLVLFLMMNVGLVSYYGMMTTYVYMTLWISTVEIYKRRKINDAIDGENIQ